MRRILPALLVLPVLVLTGCTTAAPRPAPSTTAPVTAVRLVPGPDVAVVADATAAARAVATSRALFASSPGVVLAPEGDRGAQEEGARLAVRLHVPLLLTPGSAPTASAGPSASASTGASQPAAAAEARRLRASWNVVVGGATALGGLRRLGASAAPVQSPGSAAPVAIASEGEADVAALATARAAGADPVELPGASTDLNASTDAVAALAAGRSARTVLVGARFGGERDRAWAVDAARTGWQYPGGGQRPFDGRRLFVALYGTPGDGVLGVLGQQDRPRTIARVKALAKQYQALTDRHVAPMLEVIATVAAGGPTDDGDYSSEIDVASLEPYVDAANAAGVPVVIDLQPGRTDFLTQAKRYERLLRKPGVGLALDPEWRLGPKQKPLVQIGRVSAAEVNRTSAWLAGLVREHDLPPKPFVLHQFRLTMLQDRDRIVVDRPELDTLIHVDGQGGQPDKQATWRAVRADAPDVAWGWKNFLKMDHPVLTPKQTIARVHPTPDLITYQ